MALGSFMGLTFSVSDKRILTPNSINGSTGGDWATHDVVGGKTHSQFTGPKLKSYQVDILLRAQDGIRPRSTLAILQSAAESGVVDYFVIGGSPLSPHPFKLVEVSDEWDSVITGGALIECSVSLKIEEYV